MNLYFNNSYILNIKKKLKMEKEMTHRRFRESILLRLIGDSRILNMKFGTSDENDHLDGKSYFIFLPKRKHKNLCSLFKPKNIWKKKKSIFFAK